MDKLLKIAKQAAYSAGEFLRNNLDGKGDILYKDETHKNPSSSADRGAEEIIIHLIKGNFPGHSFIAEEGGGGERSSDYIWLIDPLDGTVNFLHKRRYFGVSIALSYCGDIILGVVYNPVMDEMFTAVKGESAFLNGERIRVSTITRLDESLLSMGFPYDRNSRAFSRSVKYFGYLARDGQAIRRDGSTALSLCNVACGRYDGFCVDGNEVWDYAAGVLIVAEAGGKVTDFKGKLFCTGSGNGEVLATNGRIHEAVLKCLEGG